MIFETAERLKAQGECIPRVARDSVNLPMIRNWTEALQDHNPLWNEVAPPAMIQVWTMRGLHPQSTPDDPLQAMATVLDEAGFTSVVATNCDQTYTRYLRIGEQLTVRTRLDNVVGPKKTGLGEGYFVTTLSTWYVDDEPVATMLFRVLKYKPAAPVEVKAVEPIKPLVSRDTAYFWEGAQAGELRIQSCGECGALRHPPGPMCPQCGATKPTFVVAQGKGEVFSYVVHHHPPVPGRKLPFTIALVQLPEGVRVMGELLDPNPFVGMQVTADFKDGLPIWRPTGIPAMTIDVTPTFVVSSALATRDFQDVHHDRDLAHERGSKDIFVNILTTTGLVERYVTDALPDARIKAISIRLGVPCYAYEKLTFRGTVKDKVVEVVGSNSLGDHVTGKVELC